LFKDLGFSKFIEQSAARFDRSSPPDF